MRSKNFDPFVGNQFDGFRLKTTARDSSSGKVSVIQCLLCLTFDREAKSVESWSPISKPQ